MQISSNIEIYFAKKNYFFFVTLDLQVHTYVTLLTRLVLLLLLLFPAPTVVYVSVFVRPSIDPSSWCYIVLSFIHMYILNFYCTVNDLRNY